MANPGHPTRAAVSGRRTAKNSSAVAQALAADHGWFVFPVSVTKAPLWSKRSKYPDGSLNASTDEDKITAMFEPFPHAKVGVRLDRSGLMCVDVDNHGTVDGNRSAQKLSYRFTLNEREAPAQKSLSGNGYHFLYTAPPHRIRKNLSDYPGIDFLYHHYIVLSGEWVRGRSPPMKCLCQMHRSL